MDQRFIDALTLASFIIGLQNLELNQEQVENLDRHLAEQDKVLINDQNAMLREILKILKEIKHALKID